MLKIAIAAAVLVATVAAVPNEQQMAALNPFIGTWHCTVEAGGKTGTLDQIFTPVFDGAWLETREIVTIGGKPKTISLHYTGYDKRTKQYVHFGPDFDGSYEMAHSDDAATWTNDEGRFVFHSESPQTRTMTATAPDGTLLETMRCTRA